MAIMLHMWHRCALPLLAAGMVASALGAVDVQAPTISAIPNPPAILEGASFAPIAFVIGDPDTPVSSLVLLPASSSSLAMVPQNSTTNLVYGGTGANRTITVVPATNRFGIADITVGVTDGVRTATRSFRVTVTDVNDAPLFTKGADQVVAEDVGPRSVAGWAASTAISRGPYETTQSISFAATAANPSLFAAQPAVSPLGELSFTPAANVSGSTSVAIRILDNGGTANGGVDRSAEQTFVITITPVNDAPTLTTISTLTGATEDTARTISYATLAGAANEADVDSATISFQVSAVSSGTLGIRAAGSTAAATAVVAGTTILTSAQELVWTPASNANGTLNAFTVKAHDGALASATAVQVKVSVSAVNDAPTLTTISTLTGATEDTARTISYATLAGASNEADVDSATINFQISAVSSGTLGIRAAGSTAAATAVVAGTTILTSAQELVWTSASNANGTLNAFTVKAHDGTLASATAVQVKVSVTAVNDAPTLTTISTLTGATEDTARTISYATLAGAANEADVDSATISFQVSAVSSGTLGIRAAGSTAAATAVVAGTTILTGAQELVWTPALNATGALSAFTVRAHDGALASATPVQVTVSVAAVNDAPTLTQIPLQVVTLGSTTIGPLAFIVSDPESPVGSLVTVSASSSNSTLLPVGSISYSGTGATRFLSATLANGVSGSTTVAYGITDGVLAATRSFVIRTNRPPVLSVSATRTYGTVPFNFFASAAGSTDPDGDALSWTWESYELGTTTGPTMAALVTDPGVYDILVTVSDGYASVSQWITVQVWAEPVLYLTSATTMVTAGLSRNDNVLIVDGATVTLDGPGQFLAARIINGGVLTTRVMQTTFAYPLSLAIAQDVVIDATSRIDASARGYIPGYTVNGSPAASSVSGGSHGGHGTGTTNALYGSFEDPVLPGAGGGISNYYSSGNGGGAIIISAGDIINHGAISADGQSSSDYAFAGGAGGSVNLRMSGEYSGGGLVTANGGTSANQGSSGGGGRIAIRYGSGVVDLGLLRARGGSRPGRVGSEGSVYVLRAGASAPMVKFDNGGIAGTTPMTQWWFADRSTATDDPASYSVYLHLSGKARIFVAAPTTEVQWQGSAPALDDAMLEVARLTVPGSLAIRDAGLLVPLWPSNIQAYPLILSVGSTLSVDATSRIDAVARGFIPGYTVNGSPAASSNSGGSHGGNGTGTTNTLYGSFEDPVLPGAGGGLSNSYSSGNGGGSIVITAGSLINQGSIAADGQSSSDYAFAGGAGGSVNIRISGTYAGEGVVTANGGTSANQGSSGGGGRIAIRYGSGALDIIKVRSLGGVRPGAIGAPGTVFLRRTGDMFGQLHIDNGGNVTTATANAGKTSIWYGTRSPTGPITICPEDFFISGSSPWIMEGRTEAFDADNDQLVCWDEYPLGTNPRLFDTNSDGYGDGEAVRQGVSPTNPDMDADGLSNVHERLLGTNPFQSDSDGDGVADGVDAYPLDRSVTGLPPGSPTDTTPPVITITAPAGATVVP